MDKPGYLCGANSQMRHRRPAKAAPKVLTTPPLPAPPPTPLHSLTIRLHPSPRLRRICGSSPLNWNLHLVAAPRSRTLARRFATDLWHKIGKNLAPRQLADLSPVCQRHAAPTIPRRKRALLARPDVVDALRKRMGPQDGALHPPGNFNCLEKNVV